MALFQRRLDRLPTVLRIGLGESLRDLPFANGSFLHARGRAGRGAARPTLPYAYPMSYYPDAVTPRAQEGHK